MNGPVKIRCFSRVSDETRDPWHQTWCVFCCLKIHLTLEVVVFKTQSEENQFRLIENTWLFGGVHIVCTHIYIKICIYYVHAVTASHSKSYLVTTEFLTCVYEFRREVFHVPVFPTVIVFRPETAKFIAWYSSSSSAQVLLLQDLFLETQNYTHKIQSTRSY